MLSLHIRIDAKELFIIAKLQHPNEITCGGHIAVSSAFKITENYD